MKKLDPESVLFIAYVKEELSNPITLAKLEVEALNALSFFYELNSSVLEALLEKLNLGSLEHGPPDYTGKEATLDKELEMEYLDILGWMMVKRWQKVRLSNMESGT